MREKERERERGCEKFRIKVETIVKIRRNISFLSKFCGLHYNGV